jgi:CyaY protein
MTDADYYKAAEAVLNRIEDALAADGLDEQLDLDIARQGKMLEITFANRSQVVINLQPPLHELWLAARSGGYHFKLADGVWRDREGTEFFELLSTAMTEHAQFAIKLAA